MKLVRFALICLLAPLCLGADDEGCHSESSDAVNQERIQTSYTLHYDGERDVTYARARFSFGSSLGTPLELSEGAAVTFNDRALRWDAGLDRYEVELAGRVEAGSFEYVDLDGNRFVNEVLDPEPIAIGDFPARLTTSAAYELTWEGAPVGQDERIEVIIASADNRLNFARWITTREGATSVVLDAALLRDLARGPALIGVRRSRNVADGEFPMAGGQITTTWQSQDVDFTLQ